MFSVLFYHEYKNRRKQINVCLTDASSRVQVLLDYSDSKKCLYAQVCPYDNSKAMVVLPSMPSGLSVHENQRNFSKVIIENLIWI